MDMLILVVLVGIAVAGLAAVVAIWVERDRKRPRKFAWALSVLILLATGVTILQSILQDKQDKAEKAADEVVKDKLRGDMARMMQTLDKIAGESGDPRLAQFLSTEIEAQSRANPQVVQKLAQRYADEGEDPAQKLAKHLPKSEVQKMARAGSIKTVPSAVKIERKREEIAPPRPPRPAARPEGEGARGGEGDEAAASEAGEVAPAAADTGRGGAVEVKAPRGPAAPTVEGKDGKKPPLGAPKPGHSKPKPAGDR